MKAGEIPLRFVSQRSWQTAAPMPHLINWAFYFRIQCQAWDERYEKEIKGSNKVHKQSDVAEPDMEKHTIRRR